MTLFFAVAVVGLLVLLGLVVDGAAKVRAVQRADTLAAEAARAGGQAIALPPTIAGRTPSRRPRRRARRRPRVPGGQRRRRDRDGRVGRTPPRRDRDDEHSDRLPRPDRRHHHDRARSRQRHPRVRHHRSPAMTSPTTSRRRCRADCPVRRQDNAASAMSSAAWPPSSCWPGSSSGSRSHWSWSPPCTCPPRSRPGATSLVP